MSSRNISGPFRELAPSMMSISSSAAQGSRLSNLTNVILSEAKDLNKLKYEKLKERGQTDSQDAVGEEG